MVEKTMLPEARFIRAVFSAELPQRCFGASFAPDAEIVLKELRQQIDAALDDLSYRERGILEMRYGLGDGHAYTLAETGYVFQLTRERIRQLQVRSLKKLCRRAEDLKEFLESLTS